MDGPMQQQGGKAEEQGNGVEKTESESVFGGGRLRRLDSLHLEAGRVSSLQGHAANKDGWMRTLHLAFQSVGIIYGDIGTSPLYVYASTFGRGIDDKEDVLGVLSLIIYTLILIPMIKYVFIVLWANDNGDGGTFALYSLICRYAKVSLVPKQEPEDMMVSNYKLETPSKNMRMAESIKGKLETSGAAKTMLFLVTILGTSMVLGDGVLTPCISVLSAVSGIKESASSLSQGAIVGISVAILILVFAVQRFGTDRVGYSFAPIILLWFAFIAGIGLYNLFKYDPKVLRAFNPKYIVDYFKRNGKHGWISLGGVVLCITGTEAMFADLGHFNIRAIQISFTSILLPSVSLAYIGQAAYLSEFPENVADTFYKSIPHPLYWPTFVVAVAAAIIASQAMISGAFAIISQSLSLGCFPRVKVVHTSAEYEGQVYIPEINYILMVACVIVTASFKTTEKIGNAYGIAVVTVMLITTSMVSLIMLVIWKTSIWWVVLFFVVFGGIEALYLSSALYKFTQGGFLPLAFSLVLMIIMGIWHYVHREKYLFELKNQASGEYLRDLVLNQKKYLNRMPGIGLFYSELVQGIPPIFPHFIESVPSIHSVLIFVSIKPLPISHVAMDERFLFRQVEPMIRECSRVFRCVVRHGYNDTLGDPKQFERLLVEHLKEFIHHEIFAAEGGLLLDHDQKQQHYPLPASPEGSTVTAHQAANISSLDQETKDLKPTRRSGHATVPLTDQEEALTSQMNPPRDNSNGSANNRSSGIVLAAPIFHGIIEEEKQFIQKAMENGVVSLLGEAEVVAAEHSSLFKRIIVNHVYAFLRRNFRQGMEVMPVPHGRLLKVGMTYEI